MASRFEQVTDIDKLLALRSVGLLYWSFPASGEMVLLTPEDIPREKQDELCRSYVYYVLVEEDSDEQSL